MTVDENGKRPQLVSVKLATVPVIFLCSHATSEEFNIMLQSMFTDDGDRNLSILLNTKNRKSADVDNGRQGDCS